MTAMARATVRLLQFHSDLLASTTTAVQFSRRAPTLLPSAGYWYCAPRAVTAGRTYTGCDLLLLLFVLRLFHVPRPLVFYTPLPLLRLLLRCSARGDTTSAT